MTEQHPPGRAHGGSGTLRLAVVGSGPKALFALEELAARLDGVGAGAAEGAGAVQVTLIDPSAVLGTGAAYDPSQPHYLRLNVTSSILDAPATGTSPTYGEWVRTAHPPLAEEPYPPRAVVGEYLAGRFAQLVTDLRAHSTVHLVSGRATAVARDDEGWTVEVEQAAPAGRRAAPRASAPGPAARSTPENGAQSHAEGGAQTDAAGGPQPDVAGGAQSGIGGTTTLGPFDELLLATGHASGHHGALHHSWRSPTPLHPAVLPVGAMLAPEHIPPGSRVAVRGGALTFIDAALALTEGRGGTFTPAADGRRFVHHRGADEPAVIRPITRQGLLLDAKPDPGTALPPEAQQAVEDGRARFSADMSPDRVLQIVVDAAVQALGSTDLLDPLEAVDPDGSFDPAGGRSIPDVRAAVEHTLATGAEPDLPRGPGRAAAALERSIDAVDGTRPGGPAWALGRMWSQLYPQITETLRGSDAPEEEWARFRDAAQVLERFAFGPPLVNARKLLAMVESGAVDLSWLDSGVTIDAEGIHPPPMDGTAAPELHATPGLHVAPELRVAPDFEADVVIDAVLTPPGLLGLTDSLATSLVEERLVTVRPGRRGAMVDTDGTALTADGTRIEHLSLVGRPTEDHVIGHDTLNRHLHHEGRAWAERVAQQITAGCPHASTAGSALASTADTAGPGSLPESAPTTEEHQP
ncbi:FAD/NAD(P)-binding protein [Brachybacterium muris]|uniref:FAD/NAD(P)-binding protein n=1 Tax=Brachybacterium muris TaxID=219301 RepID=UPI0021A90A1D|nr:FAD/NAD(P)-binding protein [Brachybacterium muris]